MLRGDGMGRGRWVRKAGAWHGCHVVSVNSSNARAGSEPRLCVVVVEKQWMLKGFFAIPMG